VRRRTGNADRTVAEVLERNKASIKDARLPTGSPSWPTGSPSWEDIRDLPINEIDRRAKRKRPWIQNDPEALVGQTASTIDGKGEATVAHVLSVLRRLEAARIHYRLERTRDDAIAIEVVVPGERWEIEFLETGKSR
jgi:hypothetical protein